MERESEKTNLKMTTFSIHQNDPYYPQSLKKYLMGKAPAKITAIGNLNILQNKSLALFCSVKCPGNIILKTYDLMKKLRELDITVISGFHSPIEQECQNILLKGKQPVIYCPARSIDNMRIKREYKEPIEEGKFLMLSPFAENQRRITKETSSMRNYFAAAIANSIFISYAEQNSKTEKFCYELLSLNKPVYTLNTDATKNLVAIGVKHIDSYILNILG